MPCLPLCDLFFADKIAMIRDSFSSTDSYTLPAPSDLSKFHFFKTVSDEEIHKAIMKSTNKILFVGSVAYLFGYRVFSHSSALNH